VGGTLVTAPAAGGANTPPTSTLEKRDTPPAEDEKKLTQSDVDRIVRERVERERSKFSDYSELKQAKVELDKIKEANASDLEKAIKQAREEGKAEVKAMSDSRLVAAEARALAAEARFRNPALAIRAIDTTDVKVSDDGTVDAATLKSLLDDLAKAEPYLIDDGKIRPKPDDAQGRPPVAVVSTASPGMDRMREAYATGNTKNPT
jgi:hypothetical protein